MTKISDDVIRTPDPRLTELLSNIVTLWNLGKLGFTYISAVPTDSPEDAEIRVFKSGSTRRLYFYIPGDTWAYVALTT